MFVLYWRSKFITRFYCPIENIDKIAPQSLQSHNAYYKTKMLWSACTVIKDQDHELLKNNKNNKVQIQLFKEFGQIDSLNNCLENMPYPNGLYVQVKQHRYHIVDRKPNDKLKHIYKTNIKLFFQKENCKFAKSMAKWICLNMNVACTNVFNSLIVLEKLEKIDDFCLKGLQLLKSEKGKKGNKDNPFPNVTVTVFEQFEWANVLKFLKVQFNVVRKCECDSIGKTNIQLTTTYAHRKEAQELCERLNNMNVYNVVNVVKNSEGLMRCNSDEWYMIILTLNVVI